MQNKTYRITIAGTVQGIGFRPMVYRVAQTMKLAGEVRNTPSGVVIEVSCSRQTVNGFIAKIKASLPYRAHIDRITVAAIQTQHFTRFSIVHTTSEAAVSAQIPPDLAVCPECMEEMFSPSNRRYRYPFINCTHCGPRFSIIRNIPYDRQKTTMNTFRMCKACAREYRDPENRRFHAQPNACPVCGPQISLHTIRGKCIAVKDGALQRTVELLAQGKIVAIKSLGGYHIACDATNRDAIVRLRKRKDRPHKAFAVMVPDLAAAHRLCRINDQEARLLASDIRPIVLLRMLHSAARLLPLDSIAPGNACLGLMLPYTPLHHLLFSAPKGGASLTALVMTSGNRRDEPLCHTEQEVQTTLHDIADHYLEHDRPIHNRADDSIVQVVPGIIDGTMVIRRSRGYVPVSIPLRGRNSAPLSVFAGGAEMKSAFCHTRNNEMFMSQYIGELDNGATLNFYREAIERMERFLSVKPQQVIHDLHPDFLSTRYAVERAAGNRSITTLGVQHHHAHIASVLAEKGFDRPVIGIAYDGTGLGTDEKIWGGECFLYRRGRFTRCAHLRYFKLPGGDQAVREPWRLAVALLRQYGITRYPRHLMRYPVREIEQMIDKGINTPESSSAGRLFDAVAAIAGLRMKTSFEAQAAMELESRAVDSAAKKGYNLEVDFTSYASSDTPQEISLEGIIRGVWMDTMNGVPVRTISARFHNTMAELIVHQAVAFGARFACKDIVLSGGVFQNRVLLALVLQRLSAAGLTPHFNQLVPANDGGIALGQAWLALRQK